jgi:7-cyano-7-deazaguanine synthase in queuosine biosynthesis
MTDSRASVRRDESSLVDGSGQVAPVVSDLLAFASKAFLSDRMTPRGSSPDDPRWHRRLDLTVPVRSIELWNGDEVRRAALRLLEWLTDDKWSVTFTSDRSLSPSRQIPLPLDDVPREVMLFSGGLDAAAGAALTLSESALLAVGVVTNPAMRGYQRRTFTALQSSGIGDIRYAPVPFAVVGGEQRDDEPTRRTRGLVFLAIGVAAALQQGQFRLLVSENGVGALNLPFTSAQSGAMTSRAVHPLTLRLMSELVQLLISRSFTIQNSFLTWTKGEMVAALPAEAQSACSHSESCDNAAAGRGALERRCGHCTSCLLRRLSFSSSGREGWDVGAYLADTTIRRQRWRLPEMLWQAATLDRALRSPDSDELLRAFPDLRYIPAVDLDRSGQRRLLTAYVNEWRRYPSATVRQYLDAVPLAG